MVLMSTTMLHARKGKGTGRDFCLSNGRQAGMRDGKGKTGWTEAHFPRYGEKHAMRSGMGFREDIGTEAQTRLDTCFSRSLLPSAAKLAAHDIKSSRVNWTPGVKERGPSNGLSVVAFRAATGRVRRLCGVAFSPRACRLAEHDRPSSLVAGVLSATPHFPETTFAG